MGPSHGAFKKMSLRFKGAFKRASNPAFIKAATNYIGDAFIIASGIGYGNPVRAGSALTGVITSFPSLMVGDKKFLGLSAQKIMMNGARLAALGFIVSGSNVFGFEETKRVSEMIGGGCLLVASTLNLNNRPKLASAFFIATSLSIGSQTIETLVVRGEADLKMLGMSLSFLTGDIATFFMKKYNNPDSSTPKKLTALTEGPG